ncbi:PaaI family thioesterase [Pigmentiphaga sp.]|uniref:PaaI family thioesterase n=1 Tax=Pigmentiphaga sp. TaxID=1977564 RepID=UPI00128B9943|nr:PaaI family thioesterase [Pigmentiphaga sp.]MPS28734.1 PaaI family thioesterase [Alcaligenaceae bacterium SAGV5]MPS52503.1 PaaI family thioesterase [Alcaligenaceae bacterium SAGV3]MPT60414.1 PaaI family thioesterase [Alcaligenaceae bacterium]
MDSPDACAVMEPAAVIPVGPLAGSAVAPFAAWLGISVHEADLGRSVLVMTASARLANRRGVIHGGAIATLMDSSMAIATRTAESGLETSGTVDLNIHFIAPGRGDLTARAEVRHAGGSIAFCQCEVRDESGTLVATAMSSFKLRRAKASQAGSE